MKRYIKILSMVLTLGVLGLTSCADDYFVDDNDLVTNDGKTTVELVFDVENDVSITRAAQGTYSEYAVENIYVMVFSNGARVKTGTNFFKPNPTTDETNAGVGKITNYSNKSDAGVGDSKGTITFESVTGSNMTICAIANVAISNTTITRAGELNDILPLDVQTLDEITTYRDLQALSIKLSAPSLFRSAVFMMTGEVTATLEAGNASNPTTVTIPLKRADSKITFNVEASTEKYSDMQFIPGKWRVVNVPMRTYITPRNVTAGQTLTTDMDAATLSSDFYTVSEANAPQFEEVSTNKGSFTFYMYENMKAPEQSISATGNTGYALREQQVKNTPDGGDQLVAGQQWVNGNYVYAPEYATYVIFTGELSYTFEEEFEGQMLEKWVMADVEYCVHLGHSGTANVNDYSTMRNHHYTYNVTITGVNDLVVEVDNDTEQRPGAEGDVVMSAQRVINVDCHYDRATMALTPEEASTIYFAVNTPWERGLDANGNAEAGSVTLRDYKWVKFLINKEVGQTESTSYYAPYPGEQCYDGGKTAMGTAANSGAYGKDVTLRDIRQLSTFLADANNRASVTSADGKIYITIFIDEYLYFYDPTVDPMTGADMGSKYKSVNETNPTAANLLLWKKSVNQPDRMMHIVKAGDMKYSTDGETSLSRSVVTIKQRAIQTFYNVGAEALETAWGTETINETPQMVSPRRNFPFTYTNTTLTDLEKAQKLASYLNSNTTLNQWSNVITTSSQYGLGTNYNDATYACAMRNRDFNGDGTMQEEENQWHLIPSSQLDDLWIGEPAMPSYAKLFDINNYDGTYEDDDINSNNPPEVKATHYLSSTLTKGAWNSTVSPVVYWAEQFGATSSFHESDSWGKAPRNSAGNAIVAVRCVRNLGKSYADKSAPQTYYQVTTDADGKSTISLNYMRATALRQTYADNGRLPYVDLDEGGENNRPYYGFFVLPGYYGNIGLTTSTVTNVGNNTNKTTWYRAYQGELPSTDAAYQTPICPEGYRVPNQREMKIMIRALANSSWNFRGSDYNYNYGYVIYNGYDVSKYGYGNYFGVFYYFPVENTVNRRIRSSMANVTNGSRAVRCVQDNQEARKQHSSSMEEGGEM